MNVCLALVTHNRLTYTRKCVASLLADAREEFELVIWDNASTDGTREFLKEEIKDHRVKDIILHKENPGPTFALNQIWGRTNAELLGKVDNDCLMTSGWTAKLMQAHRDIPKLGAVACWHFRIEDFNETAAQKKIHSINGHRIFRHPWVCGTGFLIKKTMVEHLGPCPAGARSIGLTTYFLNMAAAGYVNGWYYPLILQDHMDDPFSKHCLFHDDESIKALSDVTYVIRTFGLHTYAQRLKRRSHVVRNLLYGPSDHRAYSGWRSRLRRLAPWLDRVRHHTSRVTHHAPPP